MYQNKRPPWKLTLVFAAIVTLVPLLIFILVSQLGKGPWEDNSTAIAFHIGGTSVAWYGVMIFMGFAFAILISCIKMWKYYKIPIDPFYWFCLMAIPSAIIGARFWSCAIGDAQWPSFFEFRRGGLAVEGGVLFPVIVAFWWFPFILKKPKYQVRDDLRKPVVVRQISVWLFFDIIAPSVLLGQVIGRWGNYFNQELYGPVVTSPGLKDFLSKFLPYMKIMSDGGVYHQPLFLWEGLLNLLGVLLLFVFGEYVPKKKAGDLAASYILWYGIVRLCLEPLRASQYTFNTTYIMSGLWVGIGSIFILCNHTFIPSLRKYTIHLIIWSAMYKWFVVNLCNKEKNPTKYQHYLNQYNQYRTRIIRKEEELLYYFGR
jgi:phosphatidylglycerol:prolipoprotein diacylglycerol transferase